MTTYYHSTKSANSQQQHSNKDGAGHCRKQEESGDYEVPSSSSSSFSSSSSSSPFSSLSSSFSRTHDVLRAPRPSTPTTLLWLCPAEGATPPWPASHLPRNLEGVQGGVIEGSQRGDYGRRTQSCSAPLSGGLSQAPDGFPRPDTQRLTEARWDA
ncbi:hypothetical protein E2C01_028505 [Portunus trituberculatus]|uniref:Uncharacterized protein n=1 Tax=Portunus trituberculatus TaxID=210409 RepID=A0A5B7EKT7_PORTR|nr:hypothetical protein [Portunus trituberculatus]